MQAPGHFQDVAAGQFCEIVVVQPGERLQRRAGIVDQSPDQCFFRVFELPERRQLACRDDRLAVDGGLTNLRPHHVFCNPCLVRNPVRELVPCGGVRNPRRDREHLAEKLTPVFVVAQVEPLSCLIQQVFEVRA